MLLRTYIIIFFSSLILVNLAYSLNELSINSGVPFYMALVQAAYFLSTLTIILSLNGIVNSVEKGYYNYSNNPKELIKIFTLWYSLTLLANSGLIVESIKNIIA